MPHKDRKRREPAELAAGIFAVRDRQAFHQGADRHALDEGRDQRTAGEAQIPDPAQPFRLVAKLERHAAQDQAQQHDDKGKIEGRQQRRIDDRESAPQDHRGDHQPGLVAVPDRRDGAQHRAAPGFAVRQAEQHADAEIETVEQHVEQDADGQKRTQNMTMAILRRRR